MPDPAFRFRNFKRFSSFIAGFLLIAGLTACEGFSAKKPGKGDMDNREYGKEYEQGSLASEEGGVDLFGGSAKKEDNLGITVNAYLWRAALDTVAFMPITSADPFGGVILTDWYAEPNTPDERIKLNVFILDRDLRADGVRVKAFKQRRESGTWIEQPVNASVGSSIEDAVLTRARQLKMKAKEGG